MRSVYLDSNAGSPTRPEVIQSMIPYFGQHFGNASSIHSMGTEPKRAIDRSRASVASLIGVSPEEMIFTSGATESINLALRGAMAYAPADRRTLFYSVIDHRSVSATARSLSRDGVHVETIPVDREGSIRLEDLQRMIDDHRPYLVSVPFASQEVGSIQPVSEIARMVRSSGSLLHLDLTRSAHQVRVDVERLGADLATLSSNDMLGPKGVGAIYIRKGTRIKPQITGGGHERGLRSGSENIPGIVGMGEAARIASERMESEPLRMAGFRDALIKGLLRVPDVHLNGSASERLPNNVNVRFDYIEGESILLMLDMNGVQAASGSACSSKTLEPSETLMAMGLKHEEAHGSIQMTINPFTTDDDVQYVLDIVPAIVENLRQMSPLYNG